MDLSARRSVKRLTDPRALRALAHPIRMSLVGLLRVHGPLTATRAGELLGESSASCSFHLRQLAKYGLVEEAGGGKGRERPWQATAMFTQWPEVADEPEVAAAAGLLSSVVAERYFDDAMRWLDASAVSGYVCPFDELNHPVGLAFTRPTPGRNCSWSTGIPDAERP